MFGWVAKTWDMVRLPRMSCLQNVLKPNTYTHIKRVRGVRQAEWLALQKDRN